MRRVSAGLMIPGNTPRDGLIARPDTLPRRNNVIIRPAHAVSWTRQPGFRSR